MTPGKPSALPPTRLLWIDFLRGLAVLGMIETHTVNSFLAPIYRSGSSFIPLSYLNGWVAPTFLFIAGLLQGAALERNWNNPRPLAPRLRSLGLILVIGYGLQFPWAAPLYFFHGGEIEILRALGRIDVLHCLAVSLAMLLLAAKLFSKFSHYLFAVFLTASAIVLTAPHIWILLKSTTFHNPFFGYFTPVNGGLFPLIPWAAFILTGTLLCRWIQRPEILGILTIATASVGWLMKYSLTTWLEIQTYATRYDSFLFRLSLVLLGCTICSYLFRYLPMPGIFRRPVLWCGNHSLGLYVWHLIILHSGLGLVPPLRSLFSKTQLPSTVFWLGLLTLALTIVATILWEGITKSLGAIYRKNIVTK